MDTIFINLQQIGSYKIVRTLHNLRSAADAEKVNTHKNLLPEN